MREVWIDRWKGLLILLVVVGHVVGGAAHLATDAARPWLEGVYRVIYLFHMPAFFALAGCCWKPATGSFAAFALKKAKRLLVPYAVFGVASVVLYLLLQQVFLARTGAGAGGHYAAMGGENGWRPFLSLLHAGGWPHGEGFRANTPLWFLPGRGLATLGGLSLTILLVHKFPVMALETQVPWMRQLFQTGCWGAVIGCLVGQS